MPYTTRYSPCSSGFSLMEMTLVLLVLSILSAVGLNLYQNRDRSTKIEQTQERIARVEEALMHYRYAFHRLPCPADGSLSASDSNFGMEATLPGACRGGDVEANFENNGVVAGVIPIHALNLTDEYLYDAWGRKITYVVDTAMTELNVMLSKEASDSTIGNIIVHDATGADRATNAVYALISHGTTGHGAFLNSGARRNAGITNASKLENAGVDASFNEAFTNELVMRRHSVNDADHQDIFDDIIVYKQFWNLYTATDKFIKDQELSYTGPDVLIGTDAVSELLVGFDIAPPVLEAYTEPLFVTGSEPSTGGEVSGISLNEDNQYLALCYTAAPYLEIFVWTELGFSKLSDPDTLPDATCEDVQWSPDTGYLAVGLDGGRALMTYKFNTGTRTLTWLDPASGVGPTSIDFSAGHGVAWHPNGNFLAVAAHWWSQIGLYKRVGDQFVNLFDTPYIDDSICSINNGGYCAPPCATACKTYGMDNAIGGRPPHWSYKVDWSSDGTKVVLSNQGEASVIIYDFNESGPTYLQENYRFADGGEIGGLGVKFSHDMEYVVEGTFDGWKIYRWDEALGRYVYKSNSGPDCDFHDHVYNYSFSADDKYLALATSWNNDYYIGILNYATDEMSCLSYPAGSMVFINAVAFKN